MPDRPNLLILLSDQHRRDAMGCYGNEQIQTPHFDRLSAEGVRFNQAWSHAPVCSPFRCSLQTGLYPHQHGMVHNNLYLDQHLPALPDWLHPAGYRTHYFGKAHWWGPGRPGYVEPRGRLRWQHFRGHNRGHFHFDVPDFDDAGRLTHAFQGRYDAEVLTDWALEAMTGPGPWCVQLNWGQPHTQTMVSYYHDPGHRARLCELNRRLGLGVGQDFFDRPGEAGFPQALVGPLVPQRYLDLYDPEALRLRPSVHEDMQRVAGLMLQEYYAMITSLDDQLGRVVDHLRRTGQAERTVVLYTSDHGDFVGSHGIGRSKARPYQVCSRIPLLIWGPGQLVGGAISDALVSGVDLLPTILDLAGVLPADTGGPLDIQHRTSDQREQALCDRPLPTDGTCLRGRSVADIARTGAGPHQPDLLLGLGDWRGLFDGRWLYAERATEAGLETWHLIDTHDDPDDLNDLAPRDPGRVNRMRERLGERLCAEQVW
jgi:arylsulfatase A-like enzyme